MRCAAPTVPPVPRHSAQDSRGHAGRADLHRHHRRLPRRNGGGLPGNPARGGGGAIRFRVHVHLLAASRHAGG